MILLRAVEPVGGHSNPGTAAATPGNPVGAGQMSVVLKCLKEQCSDGQVLVDLFVNYDCDLEGSNLFERMVSGAARQHRTPSRMGPSASVHCVAVRAWGGGDLTGLPGLLQAWCASRKGTATSPRTRPSSSWSRRPCCRPWPPSAWSPFCAR